ncbi:hypothetical protein AB205_0066450 [Aquarana catesbeiana]|uniref:Uncharacterized protein n=1 Tax=Aquarana catesbeiana TaxID=8400 RepID=A0A2G9S865_AQUCT|nr:hypothetical protein AB205_0066450 [Aquarana catesbeiana]
MKIVKYDSSLLGQKTITNLEIKVYFLLILTFYTKEQLFQYWEFGRINLRESSLMGTWKERNKILTEG